MQLDEASSPGPIFSLAYFRDVIAEVTDPEGPIGNWDYLVPEGEYLELKRLVRYRIRLPVQIVYQRLGRQARRRDDALNVLVSISAA